MITKGHRNFTFGRYEMRGRINKEPGSWPAWWSGKFQLHMSKDTTHKSAVHIVIAYPIDCLVGAVGSWPKKGEIDMMEYYSNKIHGNFVYENKAGKQVL